MIAFRSLAISLPKMILVFRFAKTVLGITLVNWVIATRPILNFLPSRATVLYVVSPRLLSTTAPSTREASSITMLTTGLSSSFDTPLLPVSLYTSDAADEEDSVDLGGRR